MIESTKKKQAQLGFNAVARAPASAAFTSPTLERLQSAIKVNTKKKQKKKTFFFILLFQLSYSVPLSPTTQLNDLFGVQGGRYDHDDDDDDDDDDDVGDEEDVSDQRKAAKEQKQVISKENDECAKKRLVDEDQNQRREEEDELQPATKKAAVGSGHNPGWTW